MADIRLTGINKVYSNGTHAVHDVDLHIADGEFMIMVGPSGCAKSTILRMIAGLEVPTTGTVEIGGRVVNDVLPKDRDIAMVFQSYALYPHMTVRDNMAFGLRLRKMSDQEIDQRVSEAARILGLEQLLDRLPRQMSGGQRQRVAMGRAIVREPQAFLMDEPLSNLDAKLRVQMRTEIAKLHQRLQTTTVYVTHDQVEAMTLGQRICILRLGIVQQVDTPYMVYTNPANIFVGGFIGSPGMNFMQGTIARHGDALWLHLGEHSFPVPGSVSDRMLEQVTEAGRSVVVGVRPEHLPAAHAGSTMTLPVQVDIVEALGSESYAYFRTDVPAPDLSELSDTQASTTSFVARISPGERVTGGSTLLLDPQLQHVHLFDPSTQRSLLAPLHAEEQIHDVQPDRIILPAHDIESALSSPVQHVPVAEPATTATTTSPAAPAPSAIDPAFQRAARPIVQEGAVVPRPAFAGVARAEPQVTSEIPVMERPIHTAPALPPATIASAVAQTPSQIPGRQCAEGQSERQGMPQLRPTAIDSSKLFQHRPLFADQPTSG